MLFAGRMLLQVRNFFVTVEIHFQNTLLVSGAEETTREPIFSSQYFHANVIIKRAQFFELMVG